MTKETKLLLKSIRLLRTNWIYHNHLGFIGITNSLYSYNLTVYSYQEVVEILILQIDCNTNPSEYIKVLRGNLIKIKEGRD
jgi:hypothetical protein